ncbi:hypothetical protein [Paenibacillus spongiae]|uniref:WG repeat-containing protein n=1 Tax=Paenibacillus spongiae TaxID=2909671 RepID=A0ABY5S976_9BACL|nr:hypothetical protein [Paenibacillus spongiae]UVI30068.1 hypothetical protein L1F29_32615 [Paenibacillus spongiae]
MIKSTIRLIIFAALAAIIAIPMTVYAAGAEETPVSNPPETKSLSFSLLTEGSFAALQVGNVVHVYNENGQLFETQGADRAGTLKDLFVLPYGAEQIPFVLVHNEKNGYLVFSDLWPKFAKGKEKDEKEAYYSGRVFTAAQTKIWSKTRHHMAMQQNGEAVAYVANDFDNLKKGYHEAIRVKGKLRGLVLYDCCPYLVVENEKQELIVYHAGASGPEIAGQIDFNNS